MFVFNSNGQCHTYHKSLTWRYIVVSFPIRRGLNRRRDSSCPSILRRTTYSMPLHEKRDARKKETTIPTPSLRRVREISEISSIELELVVGVVVVVIHCVWPVKSGYIPWSHLLPVPFLTWEDAESRGKTTRQLYSGFFAKHLWYTKYISTTREWNYLIWIWIIHFLIARGESSPTRIISSLQNSTSFEAVTCAAPVFFHICESAVVPIGSNEVVDIFGSEFCKSKLQELWPSSSWYSPAKSWQGDFRDFPRKTEVGHLGIWNRRLEDLDFHFLESTPQVVQEI